MSVFYHVCFAVPNLDTAMRELTTAAAVEWNEPAAGQVGKWPYRIVFTTGGPPFIELIEAPSGGPWGDTRTAGFHHLGFWTSDIKSGSQRLTSTGFSESFSGCPYGRLFAYHRLDAIGGHIELVDAGRQPSFREAWEPAGGPMPTINEEDFPWNHER
jgi:hypothetical protein